MTINTESDPHGVLIQVISPISRMGSPYIFIKNTMEVESILQYAISQLRIIRPDLHLVTYLDVGNFHDKSTDFIGNFCASFFLRFSDSSKQGQSVSLIYEFAMLAGIRKPEENLLKTSCKVAPVTKVAHIFWWRHDNRNNRQVRVNIDATLVAIFRIISSINIQNVVRKWLDLIAVSI